MAGCLAEMAAIAAPWHVEWRLRRAPAERQAQCDALDASLRLGSETGDPEWRERIRALLRH